MKSTYISKTGYGPGSECEISSIMVLKSGNGQRRLRIQFETGAREIYLSPSQAIALASLLKGEGGYNTFVEVGTVI